MSVSLAMAQDRLTVDLVKTGEVLNNPGKGIATFQRFNGDPLFPARWDEHGPVTFNPEIKSLDNPDYAPSSLSYCRWYWKVLEPEKGKYNWKLIDDALLQARRHGQRLQIRLMPQAATETELPDWYMKEAKGVVLGEGARQHWQPDYRDPKFVEYWGALIRESGRRYDGHPWLETVDLGAAGDWGEWHTEPATMMPGWDVRKQLVDIYLQAYRKTPLLMLIGGTEALAYAAQHGAGWRADCLGSNNSSMNTYGVRAGTWGIADTWKTAPVVFEVCGTFTSQSRSPNPDIEGTIAEALRWHVSSVNAKSVAIPKEWNAKFMDFIDRMGYRFEFRRIQYSKQVRAGSMMPLQMWWVNTGVAPVYRKYDLVIELRNDKASAQIKVDADVSKWMPGDDIALDLPVWVPNLAAGVYRVRVGLVDPSDGKPAIKLAIKGRTEDNWHDVGAIEVLPWELQ